MRFSNFEYYAVFGSNGLAVMDSYPGAMRVQKYIKRANLKGFDDFHDAEDWVIYQFEDRCPRKAGMILSVEVNQPIFFKNLQTEEVC